METLEKKQFLLLKFQLNIEIFALREKLEEKIKQSQATISNASSKKSQILKKYL